MTKEELKKEAKKLQVLNKEKNECKKEFVKYKKLFEEDGVITKEEQKNLDTIQNTILKIEQAIEHKRLKLLSVKKAIISKKNKHSSDDISYVESAFLAGIQNWCQTIRHTINEFEKEINSGQSNQTDYFGLIVFKEVLNKVFGKYDLISELGIEIFIKIINDLEGKKNNEDKILLRDIAHAWDDKIKNFQKDVSLHQTMFQKFIANRPNKDESALLEEIAYWPKGGIKGLPQEDAVQKAMLEVWMKNLTDSYDSNSSPDLKAGFIYLEVKYNLEESWGSIDNHPVPFIQESDIDDLYNQKALDLFKKLWKGKSILALPLDIELYINFQNSSANLRAKRIKDNWALLEHNYATITDASEVLEIVLNNINFWKGINVEILTIDK